MRFDELKKKPSMDDLWRWTTDTARKMSYLFTDVHPGHQFGLPTGAVIVWPMEDNFPAGFVEANGQVLEKASYPGLYKLLGDTFNDGFETATQFRLPDVQTWPPADLVALIRV